MNLDFFLEGFESIKLRKLKLQARGNIIGVINTRNITAILCE